MLTPAFGLGKENYGLISGFSPYNEELSGDSVILIV
jgi:hypothetical protein